MLHQKQSPIILYALLSALLSLWSCRKDVEAFRPYPPAYQDIQQLLAQVPNPAAHTVFSLEGSIPDTTLTTSSGIRVFLADTEHLFANEAGTPTPCSSCQTVKLEITEVIKKSDALARGLPTVTTDGKLLESGGMVRVRVRCDNTNLQLLPDRYLKIQLPADNVLPNMLVFHGVLDGDVLTGWETDDTPVFSAEWPVTGNTGTLQTGYELLTKNLNWINCDRFVNEPTSPFCITLPDKFTTANTTVYMLFGGINAVVQLTAADQSHQFCAADIPIGFPVELVTLSKVGDQYWLGQRTTETGTNTVMDMNPKAVTEQQMLDILKSL